MVCTCNCSTRKGSHHDKVVCSILSQGCESIPAGYQTQDLVGLLLLYELCSCLLLLHDIQGLVLLGTENVSLCSLSCMLLYLLLKAHSHGDHRELLLLIKSPLMGKSGEAIPQACSLCG